jgi:hypothetical protein
LHRKIVDPQGLGRAFADVDRKIKAGRGSGRSTYGRPTRKLAVREGFEPSRRLPVCRKMRCFKPQPPGRKVNRGMSALPPTPDVSLRRNEMTRWAIGRHWLDAPNAGYKPGADDQPYQQGRGVMWCAMESAVESTAGRWPGNPRTRPQNSEQAPAPRTSGQMHGRRAT